MDIKLYSYICEDNDNTAVDLTTDTDQDGVPDYVEDYFGTDKTKADTDGNGIEDGYEDTDSDGLINIKECEIGTSIYKADTDGDGVSDEKEIE